METKIVEIKDVTVWNTFTTRKAPWSLFQSYEWGEVQDQLGIRVIRLGLYAAGVLAAVAQIMVIRARRGTFLHIRHGPIIHARDPEHTQIYWKALITRLKEIGKENGAWFVRVSPMIEETGENRQLLAALGFRAAPIHAMDGEICWVLDLDAHEEVLLANMRKSTRYLIRQAEKAGVTVKTTDAIGEFLELYSRTAARQGFVSHRGLREEFNIFSRANQALVFLAYHEKKIVAGALILFFGNHAIYHHGASIPTKIGASHLIQWQAICEAKRRGMRLYNFWGIAPHENIRHPWKGLTLFKQGFGGREVRFMHAQDLPISPLYVFPYTIETIRKIQRGY